MKILTSYRMYEHLLELKIPESPEEMAYICNMAAGQNLYVNEEHTFYKLLNFDRKYIKQMVAITYGDSMYGISIIWDYAQRSVDLGRAKSIEQMKEFGFIQYAIGAYVAPKQRGGLIGSLLVNENMESFKKDVCSIGEDLQSQAFWASAAVDKKYLKFMLTDRSTVRINF